MYLLANQLFRQKWVLFFLFFSRMGIAQEWDMSPQPPDAASFATYGTYPVSYYTGSPSISIPIFTIQEGDVSVPITLSYSAGGVRVAQESSWVGLGWNLYPGGSISRMVVGAPDGDSHVSSLYTDIYNYWDGSNLEETYLKLDTTNLYWGRATGEGIESIEDDGNYNNFSYADKSIYESWALSSHLFQPDIFTFNVLGYSGKYYINPHTDEVVQVDKKEQLIIERDDSNWDPETDGWKIIMPNGAVAYFEDIEKTSKPGLSVDCSPSTPSLTWKITRIELKNGEEINFTYSNTTYETASISQTIVHAYQSYSDSISNRLKTAYGSFAVPTILDNCSTNGKPSDTKYELKTLTKITSPKYTIDFNLASGHSKPLLESIEISENYDNSFKIGYEFFLSPFNCVDGSWNQYIKSNGTTATYETEANYVKYKLNKLQKYSIKNSINQNYGNPHSFEYQEDIGLPSILSFAQDYWGYYNGQHGNTGLIPDETQIYASDGPYVVSELPIGMNDVRRKANANRGSSATHMKQGVLTKITYPTAGSTAFEYEPHKFYLSDEQDYILVASEISYNGLHYTKSTSNNSSAISTGAGLRIKEMRNYDENDFFASRKKFSYYESGILHEPVHFWRIDPKVQIISNGSIPHNIFESDEVFYYRLWTGNSTSHSQSFAIPNAVGYSHVDVFESDSETDTGEKTNGKSSYLFHNEETAYNVGLSRVTVGYLDSRNGLPTKVYLRDENNAIVSQTEYSYTKVESSTFLSMGAKHISASSTLGYNVFKFEFTPLKAEWWKQGWVKETQDDVLKKTDFTYSSDSHENARLLSQKTVNSAGDSLETKFYYAHDSPSNIQTTQATLDAMIAANMVNISLKTEQLVDNMLVGGSIVNYNTELHPSSTFQWEDGNYVQKQDIIYEDGHVISYNGVDGVPISFIWDESKDNPIAKVVNAINGQEEINYTNEDINTDYSYDHGAVAASPHINVVQIGYTQNLSISYSYSREIEGDGQEYHLVFSVGNYDSPSITLPIGQNENTGTVNINSVPPGTYTFSVQKDSPTIVSGDLSYYKRVVTPVYVRTKEVYFENFEIYEQRLQSSTARTGNYVYAGDFDVLLEDKIPGDYTLTYWSSQNGIDWQRNELSITVDVDSIRHIISGVSYLDDVRLYPSDAQMTSFTHDPLQGLTSQTDPNGRTTYYEYDSQGRLEHVRDDERNLLSKNEYHYKGQP
ncbi:MAG: RHS repeat protein [Cyclobacteriaceae bacterium]